MDIEDLGKTQPESTSTTRTQTVSTKRKCAGKKNPNESSDPKQTSMIHPENKGDHCHNNNIPGVQRVHIKTYGCSHNTSDSEYMMGLLYEYGYDIVSDVKDSDICIINSCTVKNPSQDAFFTYVTKSKEYGKPVIVAGCVPQGDRNLKGLENCSIVGVNQIDRIVEVVEETLKGNIVKLLSKKELPSLDLPKIRRNELIEIVPINQGCLGSCTYCKTKHARGKLTSYDPNAIVKACRKAWENGAKEIWITSEDTGVYGRDIGTDLPSLMIKILKDIPSDVMIRIGMANPPYIMEHLDKIVKVLNHPNVYSFLHIPVQAGSNAVLDKMIREYKIEEFNYVCDYLIKNVQNVTIATDIICGFPTETKEDFDMTLSLVEKYKFPVINISQFYSRPGTVAAKWKKVDGKEVKRRSTAITTLFNSYPNYDHLLHTNQRVWLHDTKEEVKNINENYMVGHTKSYAKVLIKKDVNLIGKMVMVKVTGVHKWHVYGEVIDINPKPIKVNYKDHFKGMFDENENDVNEHTSYEKGDISDLFTNFICIDSSSNKMNMNYSTFKYKIIMCLLYIIGCVFMFLGVSKNK
jgi:threonylcarbamoyladenosine tRNA methylthiotransferase CDKAL1